MSRRAISFGYCAVTLATLGAALALLVAYTPREQTMGQIQKVFYLHMPMAINALLACIVVFIASIGYLVQRKGWWDDLAVAGAKVAVLLCTGVLATGMIWGKSAWGQWWAWTPKLTFSLMLWLLYVVYLMIRSSVESPQRRSLVCAVYGVMAFLDVPLVWLSARLIPDPVHPSSIDVADSRMLVTLLVWFVPVTLMTFGLIAARFNLNRRAHEWETSRGFEVVAPRAPRVRVTEGIV